MRRCAGLGATLRAGFALLLAGCAQGEAPCGLLLAGELPVEMVRGTPLVRLGIGQLPAVMILDTGAQSVLVTPGGVQRLGLRSDQRLAVTVSGIGGSARNFAVILPGMTLAGIRLPAQYLHVMPTDIAPVGGVAVDGLLGIDILGQYEIDLDLPARRVGLYAGRACPGDVPPVAVAFAPLPGASSLNSRFTIEVEVGGTRLKALLDTGATSSLIRSDAAARAGVGPQRLVGAPVRLLSGVGPAAVPARVWRFTDMRIGTEQFAAADLGVVEAAAAGFEEDMILGADYLSGRRLWLSHDRNLVLIGVGPRAVP